MAREQEKVCEPFKILSFNSLNFSIVGTTTQPGDYSANDRNDFTCSEADSIAQRLNGSAMIIK